MTLEIRNTTIFRGPNIWARMPAVIIQIDFAVLHGGHASKRREVK